MIVRERTGQTGYGKEQYLIRGEEWVSMREGNTNGSSFDRKRVMISAPVRKLS